MRRETKYKLINTFLVPPALLLLKLWVKTFRVDAASWDEALRVFAWPENIFVVTLHGEPFGLIKALAICKAAGRPVCVLTSPSRDGDLLEKIVTSLGGEAVRGSSRSKAVEGSLALVEAVKQRKLGLLAVDGPRGPVGVPKPGFYRLAPMADARIVSFNVGCDHAFRFGSWDGLFLPLPFSKLRFKLSEFPLLEGESQEDAIARLQAHLLESLKEVRSPILRKIEKNS